MNSLEAGVDAYESRRKQYEAIKNSENCGLYRNDKGEYVPIDKVGKEDLLQLVNWTLEEEDTEFDDYDDNAIKNHAQQVVYKSVVQKLLTLKGRRQEFLDGSARLYLDEYERYRDESAKVT